MTTDPNSARRIELILQQIESLPTLPGVAMRLLQITSEEQTHAKQVVELVRSDPVLTARILKLTRSAHSGLRDDLVTVDRAVVMLGFEAIRNAVLSIKVFEAFEDDMTGSGGKDDEPGAEFSHEAFWRHCLSVAIAAELIAHHHRRELNIKPAQAFVCGLIHDLGKLALEHALPKSYRRVVELTEQAQANIADVERKLLGLDHHTAGKRLAEHWRFPHILQDVMWLHGVSYESLPPVEHRTMVGLIGLADLLVRSQHLGYSGNHHFRDSVAQRAESLGLDPKRVMSVVEQVVTELERRAEALGLGEMPTRAVFMEAIQRANAMLGRLNTQLDARRRHADSQQAALQAITRFHETWSGPGRSVQEVLGMVVASASQVLGTGFYAVVYQPSDQPIWQVSQFTAEGRLLRCELIDPPPGFPNLTEIGRDEQAPIDWMSVLPWISDYLVDADNVRNVRLMPLPCGWGTAAVMLHDRSQLPNPPQLRALLHTWGAAVGAAAQHEGARRLGEQLAETHRQLAETQQIALQNESLARLGEMAAGAAHEMNNPLMVISGRSQMLAMALTDNRQREHAELIAEQASQLSDMITALHAFAEAPRIKRRDTTAQEIAEIALKQVLHDEPDGPAIRVRYADGLPLLNTDPDQLAGALYELLINARQAGGEQSIVLNAQVDPVNGRLVFRVSDEGAGMDGHTLSHAFDPFFSARHAGRRTGMGLPRARRLARALGGEIELDSRPRQGTTARLSIPLSEPTSAGGDEDESQSLTDLAIQSGQT